MSHEKDHTRTKGYLAIIEELRKDINRGKYKSGDKLPSEKELCSKFGASRSSIREALAALCYAGIIDARCGSGYYVICNSPGLSRDEIIYCSTKIIIQADKTWGISAIKRLLAAGIDGIIVSIDAQDQWTRQIRAIRQAANDLKMQVPVLIDIPEVSTMYEFLPSIVKTNPDAIIIHIANDTEAIITVRKTIEEEGNRTSIFAWLESLENSEVLLRVSDGLILSDTLLGFQVNESLSMLVHQGINLDKLMFFSKDIGCPSEVLDNCHTTNITKNKEYDGIILHSERMNLSSLITYISILRKALIDTTEQSCEHHSLIFGKKLASPLTNALCATAIQAALSSKASSFVVPTEAGYTPRLLSKFRPPIPLIAVTSSTFSARQLKLVWGVFPIIAPRTYHADDSLDGAVTAAARAEIIKEGDIVVGVTSSSDIAHTTNSVTLSVVGDVIIRAQGIGGSIISGRITIIKSLYNMKKNVTGKIVVVPSTDASHIPLIEQAAALIVEEDGLSSHAAIACLALKKPVIIGASDATNLLLEDEQVTLDISRGMVYRGWINLG